MPNLGMPEILLILVVALVVFGPRRLPELGKSLGSTLREFRRHTSAFSEDLRAEPRPAPAASATVVAPVADLVPVPGRAGAELTPAAPSARPS